MLNLRADREYLIHVGQKAGHFGQFDPRVVTSTDEQLKKFTKLCKLKLVYHAGEDCFAFTQLGKRELEEAMEQHALEAEQHAQFLHAIQKVSSYLTDK